MPNKGKSNVQCTKSAYDAREARLVKKFVFAKEMDPCREAITALCYGYIANSPEMNKAMFIEGKSLDDDVIEQLKTRCLKQVFDKYLRRFICQRSWIEKDLEKLKIKKVVAPKPLVAKKPDDTNSGDVAVKDKGCTKIWKHLFLKSRKLSHEHPYANAMFKVHYNCHEKYVDKFVALLVQLAKAEPHVLSDDEDNL